MSLYYFEFVFEAINLTYLSRCCVMELAPCDTFLKIYAGCQGFIGPLPSAFLDKCCLKELAQRYMQQF